MRDERSRAVHSATVAGSSQLSTCQALGTNCVQSAWTAAPVGCPDGHAALGCSATMATPSVPPHCPNPSCSNASARGSGTSRSPHLVRHSLLRTLQGTRQRWRCKECGRTFTQRSGTPYHRLRKSAARFDRVIHMSMEGASQAASARVNEVSASTVSRWLARAASFAKAFQDRTLREIEPRELQADEVRGYAGNKERRQFVFAILEVWARLWIGHRVGGRTKRNCTLLMRDARARCRMSGQRVLIVTDPFKYYAEAIRKVWGLGGVHVESGKIIKGNRVLCVHNRTVLGLDWQLEEARRKSEDSKKLNTAYIERLNLIMRRALACLQRRTDSAAKERAALERAVTLLQCYYNFIRPHGSLKFGRECRTPAQQAGLVTRRLKWRDIFMAFRPMANVRWLINLEVRREWRTGWACPASNS